MVFCLQRNSAAGAYDLSLDSAAAFGTVKSRWKEKACEEPLSGFSISSLESEGLKVVTVHMYNPYVADEVLRRFLSRYGEVLSEARWLRDGHGIWTGKRQFRVQLKKEARGFEGFLHPPALFAEVSFMWENRPSLQGVSGRSKDLCRGSSGRPGSSASQEPTEEGQGPEQREQTGVEVETSESSVAPAQQEGGPEAGGVEKVVECMKKAVAGFGRGRRPREVDKPGEISSGDGGEEGGVVAKGKKKKRAKKKEVEELAFQVAQTLSGLPPSGFPTSLAGFQEGEAGAGPAGVGQEVVMDEDLGGVFSLERVELQLSPASEGGCFGPWDAGGGTGDDGTMDKFRLEGGEGEGVI
ncbi:hypothetical protein SKAU_G00387030 [Synaphobranchus kaupii]|uniref:Zinc finger CCHC domain-containing protein n=1 Tax=Synaphobranchus kaupii TaxID=118154 RepID=A0A9Q1EAU7_SYNKA|nr:hypothetical protein SKAU_G00387030 [Synaphobranchus kaupii]